MFREYRIQKPTTVTKRSQEGAVLVMSLVILLLLTIFGVSSMQSTIVEERMAAYNKQSNLAFQAAEAAVREGEDEVLDDGAILNYAEADSVDPNTSTSLMWWREVRGNPTWWDTNTTEYTDYSSVSGTEDPHYYIEELDQVSDAGPQRGGQNDVRLMFFYRVTARGAGENQFSEAMVQSVVKRRRSL